MKNDSENIGGSRVNPKSATSPTNENNLWLNIVNKQSERGEKVQLRTLTVIEYSLLSLTFESSFNFISQIMFWLRFDCLFSKNKLYSNILPCNTPKTEEIVSVMLKVNTWDNSLLLILLLHDKLSEFSASPVYGYKHIELICPNL